MKDFITYTLSRASLERKLVWGSGFTLLLLFGFYGYFVNATIMNVVERRGIESEHEKVNSQISNLEFQYISLSSDLDMERARELGLSEVETPQYATRVGDRVLTLAK